MAKLGYWELDTKAKRFYWSAEMYRIFGIPEERNDGKKNLFRDYILPEDLPIYKERLIDLLRHHKPVAGEIRIRRISGQIVYCKFTAGINGRRIAGTFQHISSWVRQRQLMKEAREKAENANREKTWFLAQASHDLRQPLQALQLFTHALQSRTPLSTISELYWIICWISRGQIPGRFCPKRKVLISLNFYLLYVTNIKLLPHRKTSTSAAVFLRSGYSAIVFYWSASCAIC